MKLFSEVEIRPPGFEIQHRDPVFCLGSCFVNEIGQKLGFSGFNTLINPFGTQFHPLAIENVFSRIYMRTGFTEREIFGLKNLYFTWDHSSTFAQINPEKALEKANETVENGNAFLQNANVFIFTLGTAWAYRLKETEIYVSNCHKIPQSNFEKELLSYEQVYAAVKNIIFMVKDVRPNARIIFTISPVRHSRDGFFENNVSKGLLHNVLYMILKEMEDVAYFPSYEIVMDELRDYRYYSGDLVHLNDLGVKFIWEKFKQNYFSEETLKIMNEVEKIKTALNHRSQNPGGTEHKKFLYNTLKSAEKTAVQLPKNALATEIEALKTRLHAH